jgi:chemotaxis protein methyltransferase CheR
LALEQLNAHQFGRFRDFIYEASGIRIGDGKVVLLSNRVRRRARAGRFSTFDAYYRYLTSDEGKGELGRFLDEITTNETFFFRTPSHFEWLGGTFFPAFARGAGSRRRGPRVWSAGCATGAEPYSIAICALENGLGGGDERVRILGTDLSEDALRTAREAAFRPRTIEGVDHARRERFFEPVEGDLWRPRAEVRALVEFEPHNLLEPLNAPAFDCVFIRNVLIYFDHDSKRRAVSNLTRALAPGGFLVVGPSEGLFDMLQPLERLSPFLYRKPGGPAGGGA